MPGNEEILQLLREMRTNANGKKETVAYLSIAVGILSGFLSFWAGHAVTGERVSRLQHDFIEAKRMQTELHARIEKVDRENDKAISALRTLTQAQQEDLKELQRAVKR
jgi:uncharacterized protein HemX